MNAVLKAYTLSQCMDAMADYAAAYEAQGGTNLIFCEDRLTLLAERALLKRLGGTFRSSVSTFARFMKTEERVISKQGSVMAVGEVMTRLQREKKLQCFTTLSGVGNNARCIYETLAQLSASEITPEILIEGCAELTDDVLKKKISDLALVYEGYTAFLQESGFVDESKYLSLLPARIREDKALKHVNVFFLCYPSFTAQARETIRAVCESAANVIGVFYAGEEEVYTNRAAEAFCRVCAEFGKVQIRELGKPLQGDAEILRKGLFNPLKPPMSAFTDKIHIFEAEDKPAEAEYVAVKIRRATAERPDLRYRDIAVLVSDVAGYSLPLKKAFGEYGIPCFVDEKRSLKRHPVSRFLLDCLRTVRERFSPASVQSLAQNLFFGESDAYRNYLLKFANYRGGAKRPIKTGKVVEDLYDIQMLEEGQRRLLLATNGIKDRGHGRDYCAAVRKILVDFDVEEKLNALADSLDDVAQKGYLAQIYGALDKVLAEAELLTGNKEMRVAEFETVLQDGLDATEISLIPLKADAVFIGDLTDSRIATARILFAMGMTDAVPRTSTDTAIVSDKEIERLAEVKTLLEPTVAEVNLRARESACLNLCSFTDELYLTYPLAADGSEPSLSDIFRYIDTLFRDVENPGTKKKFTRAKKYAPQDFAYRCSAPVPAIRQLLIEKNEYEAKRVDSNLEYSSLYTALDKLSVTEKDDYLRERGGYVCVERGEELFFSDGRISPTTLEAYFDCPFRHFANKGLKLRDREEATVLSMDTGNFVHLLLQKTTVKTDEFATEAELRAYAMQEGAEILKTSVYAMQQDTASGLHFSETLLKESADVAVAAYRQIKNSKYKVESTETWVNGEFFNGKVDRMDGTDKYVRIVDYKTGTIDDSAVAYYTGRKIQMELYMSELKGERIPAGVFYFPASVSYKENEEGRFRMQGFMNGSEEAVLCGDTTLSKDNPKVTSEFFPSALKNSSNTTRVMEEETFRDFVDYSVHVARQGCQELKEGFIAATPYEGKCGSCKYGGMCGFNKGVSKVRKTGSVKPSEIANVAREKREGK
ncbi:MAG: PD-(D/E)XK nuclease family protein [Clostridia bacterium]|nr:PD-(D/E)XK nuclease family protein [Clostridia bacterium]